LLWHLHFWSHYLPLSFLFFRLSFEILWAKHLEQSDQPIKKLLREENWSLKWEGS
jgi:hypothetical protein